jgi:hypothetical protein
MRLSTVSAAAGSALALLLPAVAQARAELAPHGVGVLPAVRIPLLHTGTKPRNSTARATPAAPHEVYVAPFGPTPIVTAYYIYVPPPVPPAVPYVDPNQCEDNGTGCTDAQLCQYWAESCDSLSYDLQPANASQAEESGGD